MDEQNVSQDGVSKSERRDERKAERREREANERDRRANARRMKWTAVFAILVAAVYGIVQLNDGPKRVDGPVGIIAALPAEGDWEKGNPDSENVLIEYSDFQCPACRSYHGAVNLLAENLGDNLRVVYRHFPLRQLHPNAQLAAQAAEAAGNQGKFWEMHDVLFGQQNNWSNERNPSDIFDGYAASLELDVDQFKKDLKSRDVKNAVNDDYNLGIAGQVNSTPTFFFNGQPTQPQSDYESFRALIQSQLIPAVSTTSTPAS